MQWQNLRRSQLDAFDRRTPVILPVAAVEQHGEHLPLACDCMQVEAIIARTDEMLDHKLLILPTQQVDCSEHHMKFSGSLTLTHETFRRAVTDVADSAIRHGFNRIFILNGHGGNQAIIAALNEQLGRQYPQVETLVGTWAAVAREKLRQYHEGGFGSVGHACEFETSLMLAIAPELIDMELAEDGGIQHRVKSMGFDMFQSGNAACYRPFERLSHNGVFGKPSFASAEKGRKLLEAAADGVRELIVSFWDDWARDSGVA